MPLDVPTLFIISTCVTAVLGLFLLLAWIQDRSIRALAWWGAAYLIGGLASALWGMHDVMSRAFTVDVVYALLFVACGIIWTGARLFHSRPIQPYAMFGGAILWLLTCQSPIFTESGPHRMVLGSLVIACYTLATAYELWRERSEQLFSRWPAICVLVRARHRVPAADSARRAVAGERVRARQRLVPDPRARDAAVRDRHRLHDPGHGQGAVGAQSTRPSHPPTR